MSIASWITGTDARHPKMPELDYPAESRAALRDLLDRISLISYTLGTLALTTSLFRMNMEGVNTNIVIDIIAFAIIVTLLIVRRRIRSDIVMAMILCILGLEALGSLVTLGLASVALLIFAACCVVVGIFYHFRITLLVMCLCILMIAVTGGLFQTGSIALPLDLNDYLRSPRIWINQILSFVLFVSFIIVSLQSIKKRLQNTLAEREAWSRELFASEQRYRLLAENMTDMQFIQDMELKPVYISPSSLAIFGYTAEEMMRKTMMDTMTEDSFRRAIDNFHSYVARAQQGPVEIPLMEYEYYRKDGSTFWGELRASFIYDRQGRITGSQGTLRDITERKRAQMEKTRLEEQLRQSEKLNAIGQLAGGIAHDFNNQLTGIFGYADLLMDPSFSEEVRNYARHISEAAQRSAELTRQMLAFARKGNPATAPLDLHTIIDDAIALLERSIDKRITIERSLRARPSAMIGDPAQLQSAVLNLALNARDAMPDGGTIGFATEIVVLDDLFVRDHPGIAPGDYIRLAITDTGTGMDSETQKHIFEPFFTTKGPGKGTGLGLAAVYGTVNSHNGYIQCDSMVGRGTTFTLYFPVTTRELPANEIILHQSIRQKTGRILLIDDEEIVRQMAMDMLSILGYDVIVQNNGAASIDYYRQHWHTIDLVIIDIAMPGMNGKDLYRTLRNINDDIKVILVSGYAIDADIQKIMDRGGAYFLSKPFKINELITKIQGLITDGRIDYRSAL